MTFRRQIIAAAALAAFSLAAPMTAQALAVVQMFPLSHPPVIGLSLPVRLSLGPNLLRQPPRAPALRHSTAPVRLPISSRILLPCMQVIDST